MNTTHTPGPWKRQPGSDLNPSGGIFAEHGPFVAQTVGGNDDANAHLIAAAPEIKDALIAALDILPDCDNPHVDAVIAQVEAAIAKAEGR